MLRIASLAVIALAIAGCENKTEDAAGVPASGTAVAAPNAAIKHQGVEYNLVVYGDCGTQPDGSYNTWAFTLDANGEPLPEGPQLLALSKAYWSVIDFYPGTGDQIIRIYREGPDKFGFQDGVLEFDGELGAGLSERAKVRIECPD